MSQHQRQYDGVTDDDSGEIGSILFIGMVIGAFLVSGLGGLGYWIYSFFLR